MSIDYYLADRKFGRLFDVGNHRMLYNEALRVALSMQAPPSQDLFCLACAAYQAAWVSRFPEIYAPAERWWWSFQAARHAANIHDFCEQAHWDVVLVNDCDGSLLPYIDFPETHTVYLNKLTPALRRSEGGAR